MIVEVATDGSTIKNPGPGGWAALFRIPNHAKVLYGYDGNSTNNRMELTAAIEALEHLTRPCEVVLTTDSQYVQNGITNWIKKWKKNGWQALVFNPYTKTYSGVKPVVNKDLWERLDIAASRHQVQWVWKRGHDVHEDNIKCDLIAREAARRRIAGIRQITEGALIVPNVKKVIIPVEMERSITFD